LIAGLQITLSSFLLALLQPFEPIVRSDFVSALRNQSLPWFLLDLLVYALLVATGYSLAAAHRNRSQELRETRLETELARAQLDALRLEIQPHFLFNTLNSIAAPIRRGTNAEALHMVLGLSTLLRATLDRAETPLVPLREEIELLERYVDLQKARYDDRLDVRYEVDEGLF
jgi:LytS/YehU family sensor histidine kinase